ncbi:MAG: hypothetical protein JRI79_16505 [Deltaproteobacteria bacterium]|nr:hypothetical protein [Deltaproteobacteria bacterium]MBW1979540.1 hypothetical protein [Deltaproteobacteria bacterium]
MLFRPYLVLGTNRVQGGCKMMPGFTGRRHKRTRKQELEGPKGWSPGMGG